MSKNRRPYDRAMKDKLLADLKNGNSTVRDLEARTGEDRYKIRWHLKRLAETGEVYIVGNSYPTVWGFRQEMPPEQDEAPMKHLLIPAGKWNADIPSIRSVFDLGAV